MRYLFNYLTSMLLYHSRWQLATAEWTKRTLASSLDCLEWQSLVLHTIGYMINELPHPPRHFLRRLLPLTRLTCTTLWISATARALRSSNSHHWWTVPTENGSKYKYKRENMTPETELYDKACFVILRYWKLILFEVTRAIQNCPWRFRRTK